MKIKTKKGKALLITIIVLLCVCLLLGVFLLVWFFADTYKDFEDFNEEFEIPALDEGVVPQGLGNYGDVYFISNYMVDGSPSRLYIVDGGEKKYVTFTFEGEAYVGHCGGVATDGKYLWICSDTFIYTAGYAEVLSAAGENGGMVEFSAKLTVDVNAAYLFYSDGYLYAGEFYRKQNYPTADSHHLTTPNGDDNTAIALAFAAADNDYGIESKPAFAFSTTEKIQGFAFVDGKYCLSQSYGLANSHILVYDAATAEQATITVGGEQIALTYLDSGNLINDYEIPCMSEGLCVNNGRVYVLFESAGKKYRLYVRERLYNVYSFVPAAE